MRIVAIVQARMGSTSLSHRRLAQLIPGNVPLIGVLLGAWALDAAYSSGRSHW